MVAIAQAQSRLKSSPFIAATGSPASRVFCSAAPRRGIASALVNRHFAYALDTSAGACRRAGRGAIQAIVEPRADISQAANASLRTDSVLS
jgi:hypothetical protein